MLIAYSYKLDPSRSQLAVMERHVEMLRLQYNFRVRERTEAYEQASCPVLGNYCNILTQVECCPLTCSISKNALYGDPWTLKGKKRSALAQQDADLPNLKRERPWYGEIQHHVLQQMLRRVDDAFQKFFKGEANYPKTKRRGKFRSFSYPPGDVRFRSNKVRLPGIGWMKFFQSRPFPNGFVVRSVTVRRKADGWSVSVRLQDESVPAPCKSPNQVKTAIGVDLGIAKLASLSTGETISNPRFGQKQERRRKMLRRRASRKKKGSTKRRKAYQQLARLENKVADQRADHHWKLANKLTRIADVLVFEDLNVKGMSARCKPKQNETGKYLRNGASAKAGLNKAILDAAWGELKQKVRTVSEKAGVIFIETNPRHTSQKCSCCGYISPTNRDQERFLCEACGYFADADIQASRNILERGLHEWGINEPQLPGVPRKVTPKKPVARLGTSVGLPAESGKPLVFQQLSLFDLLESREEA